MGKKSLNAAVAASFLEWDPNLKEPWHLDFEKEPVNDEKWSCVVTAAIPAEAADEECIEMYSECVNTGLRKAVKIISMADVVKLLKGNAVVADTQKAKQGKPKTGKPEKTESLDRGDAFSPEPRPNQIVGLAASYATFTDTECKLPSDLMAAVLKYMILSLKDENCLQKRVEAVKQRKNREKVLKSKFIRSLKPYEMSQAVSYSKGPSNILNLENPINDEPLNGPDLYILLMGIYDVFCFPELIKLEVPFLALLKVRCCQEKAAGETISKKSAILSEFWEKLSKNCADLKETDKFKDIIMTAHSAQYHQTAGKQESLRNIFNQLSQIQYSIYFIHRKHQMYLRELHVQRLIMALEPLDLAKCHLYNAICDVLVTGEPATPPLVLHAMIEQVAEGLPETESVALEYEPNFSRQFGNESSAVDLKDGSPKHSHEKPLQFVAPCYKCRGKQWEDVCQKFKKPSEEEMLFQSKRTEPSEEASLIGSQEERLPSASAESTGALLPLKESAVSSNLWKILSDVKAQKNGKCKNKKWKAPDICYFGDNLFLQMYHCDSRLVTSEEIVNRFLKMKVFKKIWTKFPEVPPEKRAFLDFHFSTLRKLSKESEESLKLKIFFTMVMKVIGAMKSYTFRGSGTIISESAFSSETGRLPPSKVKFDECLKNPIRNFKSSSHFRTFNTTESTRGIKKKLEEIEKKSSTTKLDRHLRKAAANFKMAFITHQSSGMSLHLDLESFEDGLMNSSTLISGNLKTLSGLLNILDLPEIACLTETGYVQDKDEYQSIVDSFLYYEKLEPQVMVQRLLAAEEKYNAAQYLHFAPTDTIVALTSKDLDFRGVSYTTWSGSLLTPVALRDFYTFVYPEITSWLAAEEKDYLEFVNEKREEVQAEEERRCKKYLELLKREYCRLSPERKAKYLQTEVNLTSEPEVTQEELEDLPIKPKYSPKQKISFVATNFTDLRVQTETKVYEFHSKDGTEVNVIIDTWLYDFQNFLKLVIKRLNMQLYYYRSLNSEEMNTAFTLRTTSDIIFSFCKDRNEEENGFKYKMNLSWPTGLNLTPLVSDSGLYVRQSYLKVCRSGWDIEEESKRCFLRSGQILIFKENGDLDILCASGTKYVFYDSTVVPGYEIMSTTGEIWEGRTKGPCRFRKKLRAIQKVYVGTDPKTLETYYRREDGVRCMLWPNGRLVTSYSDGTKITSSPYFDQEVTTDWTEEEKLHFLEVESRQKLEREVSDRSRTILRHTSGPKMSDSFAFKVEAFVVISCSYLLEHPKYSSVHFYSEQSQVTLTLPQELSVQVHPEGHYEVRQGEHYLKVEDSSVEFCLTCNECQNSSKATIDFEKEEDFCKVVDFFQKEFVVQRNGNVTVQDNTDEPQEVQLKNSKISSSKTVFDNCINKHYTSQSTAQKCFAIQRDMSGIEFIHADSLASDCYELPEDTYFDLHSGEPPYLSHTFSSPQCRVGYENWVMEYKEKDDSYPTNLKKKDLKELGTKDNSTKLFKYPFPKHHNTFDLRPAPRTQNVIDMPKVTVVRIIKCLSPQPSTVIESLHRSIEVYQQKAKDISDSLLSNKTRRNCPEGSKKVKKSLKEVALTLNQSLKMYPHLRTQCPSTEKDIHYFGHFIHLMEELKSHNKTDRKNLLPDCKQIPRPLPKLSGFHSISEESEST